MGGWSALIMEIPHTHTVKTRGRPESGKSSQFGKKLNSDLFVDSLTVC